MFPPVMSRAQLEKSGYLNSFPNLLGCVCGLHGTEREIGSAVSRFDAGGDWTTSLSPSDLVLSPAACYPVYPIAAARARCHPAGCCSMSRRTASAANHRVNLIGCSHSGCGNMFVSEALISFQIFVSVGWHAPRPLRRSRPDI